ncbi:11461_t:CDS:2 [Entrophospora sp. SA101]|nr:5425_t:CDS:2 [Entrophospora sp. SA101]CAJ0904264.1 11461_t:CDS:2 [Entrophospora sp. SA101]
MNNFIMKKLVVEILCKIFEISFEFLLIVYFLMINDVGGDDNSDVSSSVPLSSNCLITPINPINENNGNKKYLMVLIIRKSDFVILTVDDVDDVFDSVIVTTEL